MIVRKSTQLKTQFSLGLISLFRVFAWVIRNRMMTSVITISTENPSHKRLSVSGEQCCSRGAFDEAEASWWPRWPLVGIYTRSSHSWHRQSFRCFSLLFLFLKFLVGRQNLKLLNDNRGGWQMETQNSSPNSRNKRKTQEQELQCSLVNCGERQ